MKGNQYIAVTLYITVTWPFPKGDRYIQVSLYKEPPLVSYKRGLVYTLKGKTLKWGGLSTPFLLDPLPNLVERAGNGRGNPYTTDRHDVSTQLRMCINKLYFVFNLLCVVLASILPASCLVGKGQYFLDSNLGRATIF